MGPREFLASLEIFGIKLGLSNIGALCAALGAPHLACPVVHVAGTNGKGSVAAMTEAALRAAGLRTGRYTSPHLVRLEERVAIDGAPIAPAALDSALGEVQRTTMALHARGALEAPPTFFEATTAAAFLAFRGAGVDVAVVEVGLGGRFDATNVVEPLVGVITAIGLDHEQHLGHTLAAIAYEKAGIVKRGRPVVAAPLVDEALATLRAVCAERDAPFVEALAGCDIGTSFEHGQATLRLRTPERAYGPARLALRGRHQVENAIVAVRTLEIVDRAGLPVPVPAVQWGLEHARWPARLDLRPCAGGREVLVDGAHNPGGAAALAAYLAETSPQRLPIVFGAMADKDLRAMLAALLPHARPLVLTRAPGSRAASPEQLDTLAREIVPHAHTIVEPDPLRAVEAAWAHGPRVCVAGSLYLAGAVLDRLGLE